MAPSLLIFFTILFIQILTSAAQSSMKHYFTVSGMGSHSPTAGLANLPTVGYTRQAIPSGLTTLPSAGLAALPSGGLAALPSGGLAALPSGGLAALPSGGITAMPSGGVGNVPNTGLTTLGALGALASIPGLLQALTSSAASSQQASTSTGVPTLKTKPPQPGTTAPVLPTSQKNTPSTNISSGKLDPGVLNNLAIALQLLIVSNILNSDLPENEANPIYELLQTAKNIPTSLSLTQSSNSPSPSSSQSYQEPSFIDFQSYSEPSNVPNVNFVGTSGFTGATVSDPYIKPSSRSSFQLMSPYEALGPNSPFTDPILGSQFGSVMSSKRDFHSPYIMMDSDPFSMSDLF